MKGTKINLAFGTEVIYEDVDSYIGTHDKVGIVEENGAGKATLFHVLLYGQELDSGIISTGNSQIGYLSQEITTEDESRTVLGYLKRGRPINKLEVGLNVIYKKLEGVSTTEHIMLFKQMEKFQPHLESHDHHEVDNILLHIIDRMEISSGLLDMPLNRLSDGQKSQIAFGRVLYSKPNILLLDEPTNRLGAVAREFVIEFLKGYRDIVLIINYDVSFLNQIVNKILFIHKATHKISVYEGNYDTYRKKYTLEQRLQERAITQEEKEIRELEELVRGANQASRTNHALKCTGQERALRLEKKRSMKQARDWIYRRIRMDLCPMREGNGVPLEVKYLSSHCPNQSLLYRDLPFRIHEKERSLIVGENGASKSILFKLIIEIHSPDTGGICVHLKTDAVYYTQELEQVGLQKMIPKNAWTDGYTEKQLCFASSNLLFYADDIHKKTEILSPGEKARVALCEVLLQRASLLILDEPTNHLNPETQSIIGGNFHLSEGTVMVVSHNPRSMEQIGVNRVLTLSPGRIVDYSRELLEYYHGLNSEEEL